MCRDAQQRLCADAERPLPVSRFLFTERPYQTRCGGGDYDVELAFKLAEERFGVLHIGEVDLVHTVNARLGRAFVVREVCQLNLTALFFERNADCATDVGRTSGHERAGPF